MITGSKCEEISYCGNSFGSFNVKQLFFTLTSKEWDHSTQSTRNSVMLILCKQ